MNRYGAVVIDALISGMCDDSDDPDLPIALQSMRGLAEFLRKAPNTNIDSQLINICLRVRPYFELVSAVVRLVAVERLCVFSNADLLFTRLRRAREEMKFFLFRF